MSPQNVVDSTTTAPPETMISFDNVTKAWGSNVVLRSLDFDVKPGEKVCIIGPSGSGKTTILRILMTLEQPNEGLVVVDGRTLWDVKQGGKPRITKETKAARREIGMVFQSFNLFPHMTTIANVMEAPVKVLGLSKEEARERAEDLLKQVGLSQHHDHKPAQLSGGQQQRVAIARAMAMQPKVMLFDEPTSALDPELIGEVLNVIREMTSGTDMTMLMVTHEMRFAEEISDRVVMFDDGVAVESGPPEQIFHDPTHERTRKFLRVVLGNN